MKFYKILYNLTVYPVKINASDLQPNFIVHMNINDTNHWYVIDDIVNASDVSDKNIILDIAEFNKYYDNNALLITKDTNLNLNTLKATILSSLEYEKITGNGKVGVLIKILKNSKVRKTIKDGVNYVYNHPIVKGASIGSTVKDAYDVIKEITHKKNKKRPLIVFFKNKY